MPKEPQKSSVKPYPEWKEGLPTGPQFGILSKLNGTWVNWKGGPTGLHTTPMPSPGTSSETVFGVFHFKSQEYREQLKFTQVNAPVRNRAGSNEQFNGAVKYETAIIDNDNALQHFEDGMYIWMGDNHMPWDPNSAYQKPPNLFRHPSSAESVKTDGADPVLAPGQLGSQFIPPHTISRSGVIPHGTTIHLTGNIKESEVGKAPEIADLWEPQYLSVSPTMGINLEAPDPDLTQGSRAKPDWTKLPREKQKPDGGPRESGVNSGRAYFEKIFNYDQFGAKFPYTVQPNLKLIDANEGLNFQKYDLIELDSFHQTGVQGATINNVMIERYCRVARMRFRMWLEEILDPESEKVIDQLQYEQIVDFEFMFGSDGETTLWPHIQVNTLRREKDVPAERRLPPIQLPTEAAEEAAGGPEPVVVSMKHTPA
ncbi:MAG: peroxidase, FMP-type [Gammaproteobacteria bacterium]|nr:peroxidase, FMP-type [Gammaproteobacteria bacterium]MDH3372089.1 peroxidase, FMP-type [Gammaproteobacteria bacterium]MDH3408420.1 peroxidase, FMP-type [Gammaproteobacteria bacterium]